MDETIAERVGTLSLEQKVRLLTGADFWSLHPEPAIGLRRIVVSDGPAGVRGELWDERFPSANVPSPTALAATWDETLVEEIGRLLAAQARAKSVDVLLAPTINLHRSPFGGRHFECFSEDPLLTGRIGVAFVRGVQSGGVAATAKHFVANDSETERTTLDARIDERTLRELYLAPFQAVVGDGGVWSVMAAYNGVNGHSMTESPLLHDVLEGEFGFDGLVMSDWFATRTTAAAANAALDLAMPGPRGPWGDALIEAVQRGEVAETTLDAKLGRLLRLAARVGALDGVSPDHAAPTAGPPDGLRATLRRAAAASFVLASNTGGVLPLDPGAIGRLAVIGPNAAAGRTLGGGSATVFPAIVVSPLDGLTAAFGPGTLVEHRLGVTASARIPVAGPPWLHRPDGGDGVEVRFLGADGTVLGTEQRPGCAFSWFGGFGDIGPVARVQVHTVVRASQPGEYTIAGSGLGRYRLSVGSAVVFDGHLELAPGADAVEGLMVPPQAIHRVGLEAGAEVAVMLEHDVGSAGGSLGASGGATFQLNLRSPRGTDDAEIARAVALAAGCDAAIVVVGTTEEVESEGFDRETLALPGRQDELVSRVAAANPRTVVVVNAGAPVLLPWADDVAAVLLAWFPGQEFGAALGDVITGAAEPGGRLPTTWPASEAGLPSVRPAGGVLAYDEGLGVGHRGWGADPERVRYPFGHGIGYTSWAYASIIVTESATAGAPGDVEVTVRVRNTGARRGRDVVQVYARRPQSAIDRPVRWLAGFAAVEADPGAEATVVLTVGARAFSHWDAAAHRWAVEPGMFVLEAGGSSAALPMSAAITLFGDAGR